MFALAMGSGHFWLAIAGEVLYGVGSGTTMVAMRAVVSKYFVGNELTFALVSDLSIFSCRETQAP